MTETEAHGKKPKAIHIRIDRTQYTVEVPAMTGAQLRALPAAPIGADRDLWLDEHGAHDRKIQDDETVELEQGMRFFTAPAQINPGR